MSVLSVRFLVRFVGPFLTAFENDDLAIIGVFVSAHVTIEGQALEKTIAELEGRG